MCGIFGMVGNDEAARFTYLGLYALQHRGQEGAGIVTSNGERLYRRLRKSLVSEGFDETSLDQLPGSMSIGHVRYSTTGANTQRNVQPFVASGSFGSFAVAHNGNLTNFPALRKKLEQRGALFQTTMDSEVFLHLASMAEGATMAERIENSLPQASGAYSLLFLTEKELIAARDPLGFRPLCLGRLNGKPVISSETTAFDLIGATYEREVEPGEMLVMTPDGNVRSRRFSPSPRRAACVFEFIYFARPDTTLFGKSAYDARLRLGKVLAEEHPVKADVVIAVPDSGMVAAVGYSQQSGIPLQMGFIRNHYIGRTFIEPKQSIRGFGVKIKLNPVRSVLEGKRVVVIDDSIVRGTTCRKIIKMIRDCGAKSIHLLISSPPTKSPCFYGIDTPTKEELIASTKSIEEIRQFVGADELGYISMAGVYKAVGEDPSRFCDACFTENYPTPIEGTGHGCG